MVIGIVRLAPGQVGYFDDLTRIHLTISSPEKHVVSGMNTNNLKRAVKSGRILLVSGTLDIPVSKPQAPIPPAEVKVQAPVQPPIEQKPIEVKEEAQVAPVTDIIEETVEDVKVEEAASIEEVAPVEELKAEVTETDDTAVEDADSDKDETKASTSKKKSGKKK